MRKLQAALDASAPNFAALSGFQTAFVDNKTGEVVLMVNATSPDVVSAEAAKFLKVPYRIELVPGGFVNTDLRGGSFIGKLVGNTGFRTCMTSFAARHKDGRTGVVTAGHCKPVPATTLSVEDGGTYYDVTQGTPIWNDTGDVMFLSGKRKAVAEFYYDGTGKTRSVTGTRSRASTTVGNGTATTASTKPGAFVCHLGQEKYQSSNVVQSCGEVVSTTATLRSSAGTTGSFVLVRNTQSGAGTLQTTGPGTLRCFQGDSGGPWFAGTIALGVHSGCAWKGAPNVTDTVYSTYTSVDAFPSIGVTILVK